MPKKPLSLRSIGRQRAILNFNVSTQIASIAKPMLVLLHLRFSYPYDSLPPPVSRAQIHPQSSRRHQPKGTDYSRAEHHQSTLPLTDSYSKK